MTSASNGHARPMVSVVMPSFNSGLFLSRAIESVLGQDFESLELLVQDGGSTDDTNEILNAVRDPRLQWRQERDHGQADAINRAIERARGEWILWLNADDLLAPGALAVVAHDLDSSADVIQGDWGMVDTQDEVVRTYPSSTLTRDRLMRHGTYLYHGALLIRRTVYDKVGVLNSDLHHAMDFELLLRIAPVVRVSKHDKVLAYLRRQPESKTNTQPWAQFREYWRVARDYGLYSLRNLPRTLLGQLSAIAYIISCPLWHSALWTRIRPAKRRGR